MEPTSVSRGRTGYTARHSIHVPADQACGPFGRGRAAGSDAQAPGRKAWLRADSGTRRSPNRIQARMICSRRAGSCPCDIRCPRDRFGPQCARRRGCGPRTTRFNEMPGESSGEHLKRIRSLPLKRGKVNSQRQLSLRQRGPFSVNSTSTHFSLAKVVAFAPSKCLHGSSKRLTISRARTPVISTRL